MIKLKDIIKEFEFYTGADAGQDDKKPSGFFDGRHISGIMGGDIFMPLPLRDMFGTTDAPANERPSHDPDKLSAISKMTKYRQQEYLYTLTDKFRKYVKGRAIYNKGDIYAFDYFVDDDDEMIYWLVDLSKEYVDDAFLAAITTQHALSDVGWSPEEGSIASALDLSDARKIHWSVVHNDYRGKGFGALLYDIVLKDCGVVFSDSTLFRGSIAMWTKHMIKKNSLAVVDREYRMIVPLDTNVASNLNFLRDRGSRFLVFDESYKLPTIIKKMKKILTGVDVTSGLAIIDVGYVAVNVIIDDIEDMASFEEVIHYINGSLDTEDISWHWAPSTTAGDWGDFYLTPDDAKTLEIIILELSDMTIAIKEVGDSLKVITL